MAFPGRGNSSAERDQRARARLIDSDAKSREFVFAVQTEAPYKLISVSVREPVYGLHGMFGGFHH